MKGIRNSTVLLAVALLMLAAGSAVAGTGNVITVGEGLTSCDYNDLQTAINAADLGDVIQLSGSAELHRGNTYNIHSRSLTIRGGYDSCTANEPTGRTTLDADGQGRVFDIWLPTSVAGREVYLENLVVTNGQSTGVGGGILIEGRQGQLFVSLENVEVSSNTTTNSGGGIGLLINDGADGTGAMMYIDDDSSMVDNEAGLTGGGFTCQNIDGHTLGGTLVVIDRASIFVNQATNGGGISVEGCGNGKVSYVGGGSQFLFATTGAIHGNIALESGGGAFVDGGYLQIGGSAAGSTSVGFPIGDGNAGRIYLNQAVNGGGAYVTGEGARLTIVDTVVDANSAELNGGGVYVSDGALARVVRKDLGTGSLVPCLPHESSGGAVEIPRCSRLKDNTADSHGGALYVDGGELEVSRTIISGNNAAGNGGVVYVRGETVDDVGTAVFDSSLVHGNSGTRLFYALANSDLLVRWSTITDNDSPNSVLRAFTNTEPAQIRVASSIIWDEGADILTTGGTGDTTTVGECILGHQDLNDIDATITFYHDADPLLIEADETRPYFPGPTSPAIDFCHGNDATGDPDLVGEDRGTPHTGSPLTDPPSWSGLSNYDLGAYETDWDELGDEIFSDRYEQP